MSIHSSLRFCRIPMLAALGLFVGSLTPAHAQDVCPTVNISGSPAPPVIIGLGQAYSITAEMTARGDYHAKQLVLEGCNGTTGAASENWVFKGKKDADPSLGPLSTLTNTWCVANYMTGNYWWRAGAVDTFPSPKTFYTGPLGAYMTLPANDPGDPFGDPGGS